MLYSKQGVDKNGGLSHNEQKKGNIQRSGEIFDTFRMCTWHSAITHKRLIDTLEKTQSEWEEIKEALTEEMREHLQFVEEHNTWKALLQLLYEEDFQDLSQFNFKIDSLSEEDLKFICLPF